MDKRKAGKKKGIAEKLKKDYSANKELYWTVGTMLAIVLIFIIAYSIFQGNKSFDYRGLHFTKEMIGNIPIFHYVYHFENAGRLYNYNMFLMNDPRRNNIPVDGLIAFYSDQPVYLSINGTGFQGCNDSRVSVARLVDFIAGNFIKIKIATPSINESISENLTYANCGTYSNGVTIVLQATNSTKIEREGNCYRISVSKCEMSKALEKFEVQSVIDARARQVMQAQ